MPVRLHLNSIEQSAKKGLDSATPVELCNVCEKAYSHAICGVSAEGDEGYGAGVTCFTYVKSISMTMLNERRKKSQVATICLMMTMIP